LKTYNISKNRDFWLKNAFSAHSAVREKGLLS
jgi:hypothetical protein